MHKIVRNTVFTLVAVGLTAFGVGWHQKSNKIVDPTVISQKVLASPITEAADSGLALTVELARDRVKLGQYQTVTVKTAPFADLDIVTIYPNGSVNNPQTVKDKANELGLYEMKYKLSDFHFLGVFQVLVHATSGSQEVQKSSQFVLQTWIDSTERLDSNGYIYPLLP